MATHVSHKRLIKKIKGETKMKTYNTPKFKYIALNSVDMLAISVGESFGDFDYGSVGGNS